MPTPKKAETVEELTQVLKSPGGVYLTDFAGLNTHQFTELRKRLTAENIGYRVAKNTLVALAAKRAGLPDISEFLVGSTGLAYGDDPIGPIKALVKFAKENDLGKPVIKTGVVDGQTLTTEQLDMMANLPAPDEIKAQFLGTLTASGTQLVRTLAAAPAEFVRLLEARRQSMGDEESSSDE